MRTRNANPHAEAHGHALRVIEWIAPVGTDPGTIHTKIESSAALSAVGLKLYHRGDNQQNGFVSTSVRPDGSVYVCVQLYLTPCVDPNCATGHLPVVISAAPALAAAQLAALAGAIGEHATNVISGAAGDTGVLTGLGFRQPGPGFSGDAPFRS